MATWPQRGFGQEDNMATKKMHKKQSKRRAGKKLTSKKMGPVQTLKVYHPAPTAVE